MQTINLANPHLPFSAYNLQYTLITMPSTPGFAEVEFSMTDSVAKVVSPFTLQTQVQSWPGADMWGARFTLPPLEPAKARQWIAFLAALQGIANVFQAGDPYGAHPQGSGAGLPVCDSHISTYNLPGTTTLFTRGWTHSKFGVLFPGDYLQIGYRLYMVMGDARVNANGVGQVSFPVWPSLREQPADGTPIVLSNPVGLWRLAKNQRGWHSSPKSLTQISFEAEEVR